MEALLLGPLGPILIFFMRICDVSLATVRMLMIMRNHRLLAPLVGLVEVLIWIFAAGTAIRHLDSPWHILGYAGGFAAGNWVGMLLESRLALGMASVQVFSPTHGSQVAKLLREMGLGATTFTGQGMNGHLEVVHSVVKRRDIRTAMAAVHRLDPDAFVTVSEVSAIQYGWLFPKRQK